jgi:hypothetical protein
MYARQATQSVSHLIELPGLVSNKGIDLAISATALEHGLTVATRNVSDFEPTGVSYQSSILSARGRLGSRKQRTWRAPIFPPEHSVPSPWCHAKQSAPRRRHRRTADGEAIELPCEASRTPVKRSCQSAACKPRHVSSAFPERLGGPPSSGPLCLYAFDITRF